MATIFISHSSRDAALSSVLVAWLKSAGFDDLFIDQDNISSGDKWTETLRRAKGACRVVLCLVTPNWLTSDECNGEFLAGWYAGKRIIPLFALGDGKLDEKQQSRLKRVMLEDQGADIGKAGAPERLDLDAHPDIAAPLKAGLRAAGAMTRIGLDPYAFETDQQLKPEPFPGLASFDDTDADAAIFFGRSQEIAQCLEDLREIRATGDRRAYLILGASGSGKSSLMKAGVLPRLRRERAWFVLRVFRPGPDPLYSFADAIARSASAVGLSLSSGSVRDSLQAAWARQDDLRAALEAIIEPLKIRANCVGTTTLIALDQAEELARAQGTSAEALGAYLKAVLAQAAQEEYAHFSVMLTLRSDCFREIETSKAFEGLETRAQHVRSLPLHRMPATIEQPAARYGVEIEPQLVDALMEDSDNQDALPLFAFTLQRLWRQYAKEKCIKKAHYDAIGKLSGLIEDAAERALRGMDPFATQSPLGGTISGAADERAAHIFLPGLAQLNERGAPTRRVALQSSFDQEATALLDNFVNWRLVVRSSETVEVAHEALFREWPRFRRWLTLEKGRLEALREAEKAAASWTASHNAKEYLTHRGKRLVEAMRLYRFPDYKAQIERNPEVRAYLDGCTAAARRHLMMITAVTVGVVLIAVIAVSIPQLLRYQAAAAAAEKHRQSVAAATSYRAVSAILTTPSQASTLASGAVFRDCAGCPEMIVLPAGHFMMGSPADDPNRGPDEGPQHNVVIPRIAMNRYAVTFGEWAACAHGGGCKSNPTPNGVDSMQDRRPVVDVSWSDA